ncbi:hypothetical protein C5Y93_04980 [Blastopirellula marina]|uniref:Uncharacterized protein n=2 Tax=Blastopirellula marina TaxID=124 RepID=A0A2S8GSK1_9BACT|nr:hypothetical protein C5Y93_04980 [Blastopirellula marina]
MERFGFWTFLLILANHAPQEFYFGQQKIICKRGQIVTGRESLASQSGLHPSKVQRFLTLLEKDGQIEQQMNSKYRIITLKNWDAYQGIEPQVNSTRTAGEHKQECKNDKNVRKQETNDSEFENELIKFLGTQQIENPRAYLLRIKQEVKNDNEAIRKAWKDWQRGNGISSPGQFFSRCIHYHKHK